ncbi:MAG: hypothetical protein HC857_00505 [Synechococcales cyanobacterium RU_4_20]|nr:hypothetical protein [Synechococcales cyanobacterium RU_4_20]
MLIGTSQTLIYSEDSSPITLLLEDADYNFPYSGHDDFLSLYGCDRTLDPEYTADIINSSEGASFWFGRNLEPHLYKWQLWLSEAKMLLLEGMILRQQREKKPVLLLDQRLAMHEPTPRTRAKVGTLSSPPSVPGTTFFWPILKLKLDVEMGQKTVDCNNIERRRIVLLSGKEILPYPGPSEDR